MDLYSELLDLIDVLAKEKLDYALCGGVAVAFHGYPRFTKDIDILILPHDLDKILAAIRGCGFSVVGGRIPFDIGQPNQREIFRISKIEGEELLTLDLVLGNPVLQDVWADREVYEWQERLVQVVSTD
ncbi:MAG: nucleotidyltransferase family protein, partial [Planctomycetes bacterium]|nr:nucleotidyltransferase family protein [Planctomycetota bacterium]